MPCRRDSDVAVGQPLTSLHCDLNECSIDMRTGLRHDILQRISSINAVVNEFDGCIIFHRHYDESIGFQQSANTIALVDQ